MATKTAATPAASLMTNEPSMVNLDAHEEDKARRAAVREAKREELTRCLDARYAARRELEKPLFRYRVKARFNRKAVINGKTKPWNLNYERIVSAQNERDAWALFCDKIPAWYPSRHECRPLEIEELGKVDVADAVSGVDPDDTESEVLIHPDGRVEVL